MAAAVAVVVLVAGLIAWIGQSVAFLAPGVAVGLGLLEPEEEIDRSLRIIEAKAMGFVDMSLGWTLPASALLMLLNHPAWPYLALLGAGVFIYFSALFILSRVYLKRAGRKVGRQASERAAYAFGAIWILCALSMAALAVSDLSP